ncbi:hypothetical protein MHC_04640 [Mycoplasma haemocanis str. Illinois]|uniref:Uncharacterized protein n=1 Tax=Mycoplasma haemocanis (strain Illinois) TaxID=1111676 RepID=H6N812_MYCHN|nr:hypothetical protein [Mycoplasma haemocanis]AEW45784.1 hypothetical protein MHC_04640 [Mycoplasma haemocanis str. Illinois]
MTAAVKTFLLAGGTASALGAGAIMYGDLLSPKIQKESIASFLSKNPVKRAIGTSEEEDWKKVWKMYKDSKQDIWNLGNLSGDAPTEFKNVCKEKLNLKVSGSGSEEYKDFLLFCSRDTLISDLIRENNKDRDMLEGTDASSSDWKNAWKEYSSDSRNQKTENGSNIWNLNDWKTQHSQQNAPQTFIDKCVANIKHPSHNINDLLYLDTVKFCTKNKTSSSTANG